MYDVVVVGAGPVGSYASGRLSERGLKVLLIDRKERPGRSACAGIIGSEAFDLFPLPRASILNKVKQLSLLSPSGVKLDHKSREPMAYAVDRLSFDMGILEWASKKGAVFRGGLEALVVERGSNGVSILCKRSDGSRTEISSRLAIVASGCGSRLIKNMELGWYPGVVVGVQRVCLMEDVERVEVYFGRNVAPGGFSWLVPLGDGRVRVGLVAEGKGATSLLDKFISSPCVSGRLLEKGGPVVSAPIPKGPLPVTYGDGFLVVGEAAGQVKATTYGGVFYGLICGDCAIDTVISAFDSGRFDGAFLSSYQSAWKDKIGSELEFGSKLRDVALRLSDRDIDRIFLAFSKNGLLSKFKSLIKFDWHAGMVRAVLGYVVS